MELNVLIVTPGHPGPDLKSAPPSLTAPYIAALITNIVSNIQIVDLAVQKLDIDEVKANIALLTTTMGQLKFPTLFSICRRHGSILQTIDYVAR